MRGLSVRWSLADAPAGALEQLRTYVADISFDRFAQLEGLRFKTWRAVDDAWFEGTYVFTDDAARASFQAQFEPVAATSPVSTLLGHPPMFIEPCDIVAVVEGQAGFEAVRS